METGSREENASNGKLKSGSDSIRTDAVLDRHLIRLNQIMISSLGRSMVSAQMRSAFVAWEKPVPIFPDHASESDEIELS
jgi:hypothetical protein